MSVQQIEGKKLQKLVYSHRHAFVIARWAADDRYVKKSVNERGRNFAERWKKREKEKEEDYFADARAFTLGLGTDTRVRRL